MELASSLPGGARHRIRSGLLAGFALGILLTCVILIRYPGNAQTTPRYLSLGLGTLAIELVMGLWVALWGTRPRTLGGQQALQQGVTVGVVCGVLWIIEIGFNNIVPPTISTGGTRFYVDNGIWIAIMLLTLVASGRSAYQQRSILRGVEVGAWSGLVSGLLACLMGSLLIAFFIGLITRDPLMIQEFAQRGPASGAPDLTRYTAYETLTGSVGHLTILGPVMGALLGTIAGLVGKGVRLLLK